METSASFEARYAPSSHPTEGDITAPRMLCPDFVSFHPTLKLWAPYLSLRSMRNWAPAESFAIRMISAPAA